MDAAQTRELAELKARDQRELQQARPGSAPGRSLDVVA
jgi:hypothetical protein